MPLFYQHTINEHTKLAVWHITEPEDFFLNKVTLKNDVSHPHKRLQHLAGRFLLQLLEPQFPLDLISISDSKKPLLIDEAFHFSISHCGNYAATIVSNHALVGIDVELISPKIKKIHNKFLSEKEIKMVWDHCQREEDILKILTLFWSAKESMVKWYGKGKVDFKKDMQIQNLFVENDQGRISAYFGKEMKKELVIQFHFFDELCLAWVEE